MNRGGAGVSRAGVSNAGAGVPSLELVSAEMMQLVTDLCERRNTLIHNIAVMIQPTGVLGHITRPMRDRALELDKRARILLWVAEKAELTKLSMSMREKVTLAPPAASILLLT